MTPWSLSGCSRKCTSEVAVPSRRIEENRLGRSEIMQSDYWQLARLLPLLDSSRRPDSVSAARPQQHHFTRCITTEAITLTGLPNSNSEKNLYQGSFFKSISSGLISRLYKGWWQGNGRKRRITLCKRLHRSRPVEMQHLWVTQRLLQQQTPSSFTDIRKTGKPRQGAVGYLFSVQRQRQMDWT